MYEAYRQVPQPLRVLGVLALVLVFAAVKLLLITAVVSALFPISD